ncbi:ABC transporter ATP-binding protein [Celerinatantimonas diazotrophica]|uniref:ABC-2 type transport system ATP-binding protein n=1 Tax=Celerinatantimonas diazotrophica TaxID=412034 RepID=A0A4V6NEE3_9GAMM|nr:ABC transporter ATP-binding protein [Celerinatantimonas diazotrophica]TCK59091.1 ABC-2 type transport system ATP-binding protein [Celerinatantimonas diazotrophica]CAG9297729.1 Vitamin B12 import ATP-binding protein BtuD [Celerinatantimonas diazotrophica]
MLKVSKLMRKYGRFTAVKDATFTIEQGEIVGLLGHNGAGKTTILKMLSGYLEPHQGSIELDGIDVIQTPKQAQTLIGYLPENLPLYGEMSVAEYLNYAATIKGIDHAHRTSEIKRVILATDIKDKALNRVDTLSRGYKQRVGVAQALLGDPRFLILDEPTNGLDPTQTFQMRNLIKDVAKHATVILSTHIMQEVEALCDRVLIIRAGELAVDSCLEELKQTHQLIVQTTLSLSQLNDALSNIDGIVEVRCANKHTPNNFHIELSEQTAWQSVSPAIAQAICQQGQLLAIEPRQLDLEALFKQVNEQSMERTKDVA